MNAIQISFMAMLFLVPLFLGFSIVSSAVLGGRYLKYLVYVYLLVLIVFTGSTYGVTADEMVRTIYGRGTGKTFFGFVNLYLYWLALTVMFESLWSQRAAPRAAIRKYLFAFVILFIGHIVVGMLYDVPFFLIISKSGILHLINMIVFIYVMLRVFRSEQQVSQLVIFMLVCIVATELWGLFRFVFLGGDPANYYENVQDIAIRLTFFDIDYSVLGGMAAFLGAWRLIEREADLGTRAKLFYWVVVVASVLTILFSYRRTAWVGLLLMGLLFVWLHRKRINFLVFAPVSIAILLTLGVAWAQRYQGDWGGGGHTTLIASLFPDSTVGGSLSMDSKRLYELKLALMTIRNHVFLGVGTWGEYTFSRDPSVSFHRGYFNFMHSGFLHVWLKTGLIGLALFVAVLLTSAKDAIKAQSTIESPRWRALAATGLAGLMMFLPTLLFGTPLIEYRTMQLLGLVLVLPYLAQSAAAVHKAA